MSRTWRPIRARPSSCVLHLLFFSSVFAVASIINLIALTLTSWGNLRCTGDDMTISYGIVRFCREQILLSGNNSQIHHNLVLSRNCYYFASLDLPIPVWLRSLQLMVFSGQVLGTITSLLTGLYACVPAQVHTSPVRALAMGAMTAGILVLLGAAINAGQVKRHPDFLTAASLTAANQTLCRHNVPPDLSVGVAHQMALSAGWIYVLFGLATAASTLISAPVSGRPMARTEGDVVENPRKITKIHQANFAADHGAYDNPGSRNFGRRLSISLWE